MRAGRHSDALLREGYFPRVTKAVTPKTSANIDIEPTTSQTNHGTSVKLCIVQA